MSGAPRAIHHLNCGSMCPRGGRLLGGDGGLLSAAHLVCHCLLVECAQELVLIDTGFGLADVKRPQSLGRPFTALVRPRLQRSETAAEQIRLLGFDPSDVRQIITTHLDLDHAGGLPDFPGAQVHVMASELEAAMHPSRRERLRYIAEHWRHGPQWVSHPDRGEEWFGFQSVRVLPGSEEEILMVPLAGHSAGHSGVAVRCADGWLVHCGDAYFHRGEVAEPPNGPLGLSLYAALLQVQGNARRENLQRLRELSARRPEPLRLLCSHDRQTLLEMQQAAGSQGEGSPG